MMTFRKLDISRKRFHPLWLIIGALIGWAFGYYSGLDFGQWYFASGGWVLFWEIVFAIFSSLFYSFMMTSNAPLHTKGAILGLGTGFAFTVYAGEIYMAFIEKSPATHIYQMSFGEGIFYDWVFMHFGWFGCIAGWIIGTVVHKKRLRRLQSAEPSGTQTPEVAQAES